jgi:hypothetical protein
MTAEEAKAKAAGAVSTPTPAPLPVIPPQGGSGTAPPQKERERTFALIADGPDDGYTLKGVCEASDPKKGRLVFYYRPALPDAVYEYRSRLFADGAKGIDRLAAVKALLGAHVVSWDMTTRGPGGHVIPLPFTPAALDQPKVLRALGVEYLDTMANYVTGYTFGEWEADAKNS